MTIKCLCVVLFVAVSCAQAIDWKEPRVKYNPINVNSFYLIPRTVQDAENEKWAQPDETIGNGDKTTTYCLDNDSSSCALYDKLGTIAGWQVSIPRAVDHLEMPGINYNNMGWENTTLYGDDLYSTKIYLVPQKTLETGRIFDGQIGVGLWLNINGELVEIPNNEADIASKTPKFIKQNCFNNMGRHYFYDVSPTLAREDYNPFFLLYTKEGELQGFGLVAFGKHVESEHKNFFQKIGDTFKHLFAVQRDWWEFLPAIAIRPIAPDVPQWVLDYVSTYGPYSQHFYFKEQPWNIKC